MPTIQVLPSQNASATNPSITFKKTIGVTNQSITLQKQHPVLKVTPDFS